MQRETGVRPTIRAVPCFTGTDTSSAVLQTYR